MDKKTLLGLALIVLIMIGWGIVMMPSKAEREKQKLKEKQYRDSILQVERQKFVEDSIAYVEMQKQPVDTLKEQLLKDSTLANLPDSIVQKKLDSLALIQANQNYGAFSNQAVGKEEFYTVETDKFILTFLNRGAQLYSVKLKGYHTYQKRFVDKVEDTLDLMIGKESGFAITLFTQGKSVNTDELFFTADKLPSKITGDQKETISFKAFANGNTNQFIQFNYSITGNSFLIDFDVTLKGLEKVIDGNQDALPLTWVQTAPSQEQRLDNERDRSKIFYKTLSGDINSIGKKEKKLEKEVKWVSFKQQFFSSVLIAKEGFTAQPFFFKVNKFPEEDTKRNMAGITELAIPYGYNEEETFNMQWYFGPNHYNTLKKLDQDLEEQIDLGPFFLITWINKGVIVVFNYFQSLNLSYGLIILLLTIIIKLITAPVTYKTFKSSAKMRILKPDIDALSEKFKPGEELQKQQAIMQLYKRAGVSPLAGCIPALLQMPILLAMFSFFPAAIELRQQGFLWAEDFSTYDSILQLPFHIPFYGSHVSLFTLLMTITTLIYTKMSSGQMTAGGGMQAKQMQIMMYIMPIIFLGVLNNYSAALSYYYFLSNLVSILLMLFIRKFMVDEDKLRLVIEENKKRPVKKSKWAQRLEDMQKIREEQIRNQRNPKGNSQINKGKNKK